MYHSFPFHVKSGVEDQMFDWICDLLDYHHSDLGVEGEDFILEGVTYFHLWRMVSLKKIWPLLGLLL